MPDDLTIRLKQLKIVHYNDTKSRQTGVPNYDIDIKKAYGDGRAFELMTELLGQRLAQRTTCIAVSKDDGLLLAGALAASYGLNQSFVRTKLYSRLYAKAWELVAQGLFIDYDFPKCIEGYVPSKSDKVAIVGGVFSDSENLENIIDIITPTGAEIVGCYVLFKQREGQLSVPVESVLRIENLL